jgi:A/G-specific adenine glycosylase
MRALVNPQDAKFREQLLRTQLLAWYDEHARDLPWRESRDPYRVWLSEIMLQQTRVAAVIAHYHEFLRRFPTVEKLARAREASVLAAWSGLGYYRRARMLHAAAKVVVRELGGKFPATAEGLRDLPGVGRYTAAAIASIAFGEPMAVVDGNVERVLQRVSGRRLAGEEFWLSAERLLDRARPGDFNQAMMELGATVCTPRVPACLTCPVVELCATRGEMAGGAKVTRHKKREIHYALDFRDRAVFLVQRARDAAWMAGMWELPEVEGATSGAKAPSDGGGEIAALNALRHPNPESSGGSRRAGMEKRGMAKALAVGGAPEPCFTVTHSITVTDYTVRVWRMPAPAHIGGERFPVEKLARVALTGLARKILRKAGIVAPIGNASSSI